MLKNVHCDNALIFYLLTQNALGYHGNQGLLSSLVGWISGNVTPSFVDSQSLNEEASESKYCFNIIPVLPVHQHRSNFSVCLCRFGLLGWC